MSKFERLYEWWWHPERGIYGHEEPAREGDRPIFVQMGDETPEVTSDD